MNQRIAPVALVILALFTVGGCVNRDAQEQAKRTEAIIADKTIPVEVVSAEVRSISDNFEVTGTIVTSDDTQIGAKIPGRLVAVFVKDGDPVATGQVIAQQDTTDLQTQVRQAQAGVDAARSQLSQTLEDAKQSPERSASGVRAAQAQLAQAQAGLNRVRNGARREERRQVDAQVAAAKSNMETAGKGRDRVRSLFKEGALSQADVDAAENGYASALSGYESSLESQRMMQAGSRVEDVSQAEQSVRAAQEGVRSAQVSQRLDSVLPLRVDQARAALRGAEETLRATRQALSDATIRSPYAGRISGRTAQPGTYLGPGAPITRVVSNQGIYFEADVPENRVGDMQPGRPVAVTVDALKRTLTGRVAGLNPLGTDVGRVFRVRVSLADTGGIQPGMFARGKVQLGTPQSTISVPDAALVKDGGEVLVYVVEAEKAKRVVVKAGLSKSGFTAVNGLSQGAQVVIRGQQNLVDGATVRIGAAAPTQGESAKG